MQTLRRSSDAGAQFAGTTGLANIRLLHGQSAEALRLLSTATARPSQQSASARNDAAVVRLAGNQPAAALDEARRALADAHGVGDTPPMSLFLIGVAQARLGNASESQKAGEALGRLMDPLPGERLKRWGLHVAGRIALMKGDHARAIEALQQAESRLPPFPFDPGIYNEPIALWFDLGSAFMAGQRPKDALSRFQRVVDAGIPRLWNPVEFVQSLYFLAQCEDALGEHAKAVEHYRKFLQYWGDGDIDRDRVATARTKLSGS
jgi:hypothetical protein